LGLRIWGSEEERMFTWDALNMWTVEAWGPSACLTRALSVFALVNHSVQETKWMCAYCSRMCVGGSLTRQSRLNSTYQSRR
jgi:hypothetical protein